MRPQLQLALLPAVLAIVIPGCGTSDDETPDVGKAAEQELIDEVAGSYRGVAIGDTRRDVLDAFGPVPTIKKGRTFPRAGGGGTRIARAYRCEVVSAKGDFGTLIYEQVLFETTENIVCGWTTARDGAATTKGLAIGDPLDDAARAYPALRCDEATEFEGTLGLPDQTFPFCAGKLGTGDHIWFGGDPIDTIQMNSRALTL